ncbi:MAG: hypothetical protein C4560_07515 [Nitrospiraceae bacterium]|nr:MAG: hypothetical protein C4560_07515 [Nitrospiraceae bacterium]
MSINKNIYFPAGVLIASLIYYLSYASYGFLVDDWGMIVVAAEQFLEGKVFYRDFSILYTPGIYLYTALAFKMFGKSLYSAMIAWSILRALSCVLIYLIGLKFVPRKLALILPLFLLLVPGALHKSFFIFFALLNSLLLVEAMATDRKSFYILSGIVSAITLIFRVDLFGFFAIGLVTVHILGIWWSGKMAMDFSQLKKPLKNIFFWGVGVAIGISPFAFYLYSNSALVEAYRQSSGYTTSMRNVWFELPPLSQIISSKFAAIKYLGVIIPFFLYFLAAISMISIARMFNEVDRKLLVLFLFGCMMLNQVIIWPGFGRISLVLPPVLVATVYLIYRYYTTTRGRLHSMGLLIHTVPLFGMSLVIAVFILFSCYTADIYSNGSVFRLFRDKNTALLTDPRLQVYADHQEAEQFMKVSDAIRRMTDESEYVFTFPNNSLMYHFVTGRRKLEKFSLISEYLKSEEKQREVIRLLEEKKVRLVVSDLSNGREYLAPIVHEYIKGHYEPKQAIGSISFLVKKQ